MKKYILICLMAISCLGYAQDNWTLLARTTNGAEYLIDKSRVIKEGNSAKVWIKLNLTGKVRNEFIATMMDGGEKEKVEKWLTWSYDLNLYEIDCKNNKYRILSCYSYNKDGVVIYNTQIADNWKEPLPESVMEEVVRRIKSL